MQPTTRISISIRGRSLVENKVITLICFPANWLNRGNRSAAIPSAINNERKLISTDSVRNCVMRLERREPATFLMPISFKQLDDRKVERFMKLTQAINRIKIAMREKIN